MYVSNPKNLNIKKMCFIPVQTTCGGVLGKGPYIYIYTYMYIYIYIYVCIYIYKHILRVILIVLRVLSEDARAKMPGPVLAEGF